MNHRIRQYSMIMAVLLASACARHGVEIISSGENIQKINLVNCNSPEDKIAIKNIELYISETNVNICSLKHNSGAYIFNSWEYGSAVTGYDMHGCGKLNSGTLYRLQYDIGDRIRTIKFSMNDNGLKNNTFYSCW